MSNITASTAATHNHDRDYSALLTAVETTFQAAGPQVLFVTDAEGLFDLYLDSLPSDRQTHNCHCCRRFIETYGGLVSIDDAGNTKSVMWSADVPGFYGAAFAALKARIEKGRVVSPFKATEPVWGTPITSPWTHLSVVPAPSQIFRERAITPGQSMAAAKESYKTVMVALGEFKPALLDEALRILKADAVARAEKFVAPVQWLRDLHDRPKGHRGENLLWRAIASAPEGYLHPRAAVTGTLLEDIAAGLSFDDIKRRFAAKMDPLQYQRPQALPSAGNIKAAEELFAKLGLEPALHRRFARREEVPTIWVPKEEAASKVGGIFGHLKRKGSPEVQSVNLPAQTMTWDKFSRTVLPGVEQINILVPSMGNFIALTTAVNADAPPILKWDRDDERNPLAWYVYPGGSSAAQWGLSAGAWAKVTGVSHFPNNMGSKPMPFLSEGVILLIEGAADSRPACSALFPECLKEDLHGVRSTIEAHSKLATCGGREQASACGYDLRKAAATCRLRVLSAGAWAEYQIDRWD